MSRHEKIIASAALLAASASPAYAVEVLVNGNFESGITGWTTYTTANGTITEIPSLPPSSPQPQVATTVSFNTTGSGASKALFLNAGAYQPPYGVGQQGGGVFQTFTLGKDGTASFSADIAALTNNNSLGVGLLSVLLDGVVMDSFDFGALNNATARSTLDFTSFLTAGDHTISLQATRAFAPARGVTSQYFDNASLNFAAVPEPATWAMMILGMGVIGRTMRRRRAAVRFAF
ncbi:PEPxxWA-CTERM sorting domain-containing protein [Novosphingobium sp. G106]|uniref:PEPxxWA-CTERM sorting domain-containing protein n=1 Tax=Novosphingobium sp. G106 TaxID=2849500 RepID=UPI0028112DF8|nr:PEPxxWA-CTERM sorting domain-containing protein [Novosphingobium sp. G106]